MASKRQSARQARERSRRLGWLTEAQAALGWGIILILAALLGVIYLSQTSRIATVGRRVQFLQEELDALRRQNAALERQIAEAQSLEYLQAEAQHLGFGEANPEAIEYLIVPDYPQAPSEPMLPAATPQPPPAKTMGEALWLAVRGSVTDLMRGEAQE
ncbi:MAG: hypothetical protein KC425_03795 [Anaerolineales bacterium]|nr:hypothetical protein [Anaerolineales bacterium]MCB0058032.1 hypothetical protein [Caldilineaceae bacterium]